MQLLDSMTARPQPAPMIERILTSSLYPARLT